MNTDDTLDFDEHQDLSSFTDSELSQLLQLNQQTSSHYATQLANTEIPAGLKQMYQLSKEIVDSDIQDIQSEIKKRANSQVKNDTAITIHTSSITLNG